MTARSFVVGVLAAIACVLFVVPVSAQSYPGILLAQAPPANRLPPSQQGGSTLTESARTRLAVPLGDKQEVQGLPDYINTVYRYMLGIVTIVAIIMVIYGAFLFLLSHGDAKKASDGQRVIKDALGGMAVLFLAYFILYNVNPRTTRLDLVVTPVREVGISVGRGCADNADCSSGQYCSQGPYGSRCVTSPFGETSVGGIRCSTRGDCPAASRCGAGGTCEEVRGYYLCTDSTQCANGQTCIPESKICCADESCRSIQGLCGEGNVCPTGTRCFEHKQVCRTAVRMCTTLRQCEQGETCVSNQCQLPFRPAALPEVRAENTAPATPSDPPIAPGSRAEFETCIQNQDCRTGLVCARFRTRSMCARPG